MLLRGFHFARTTGERVFFEPNGVDDDGEIRERPVVHMSLHSYLRDPRWVREALASHLVTELDVEELSTRVEVKPAVLVAIASSPWATRPAIQRNLAINPNTPHAVAARFLGSLGERALERIALSRSVTPAIAALAAAAIRLR